MKINEDMKVAGNLTAEELDGKAVGNLRAELNEIKDGAASATGSAIAELTKGFDTLNIKLDTIIEFIGKIIENKEKREEIL